MTPGRYIAFLVLLLLAPGIGPDARAQDGNKAVQTIERHYRELVDLKASVVQKNFLKSLDRTQTFEGTLWIKKPGRLRLEYTNGQMILVDGKTALFYSKKSEQVIKKSFSDIEQMNIPVAFLLGAGQITDSFEVLPSAENGRRRLELAPRKAGAAMKKLAIASDGSGRITELTIYDRSGNVTEIRFSAVAENTGMDNNLFRFVPPRGTEVIEE